MLKRRFLRLAISVMVCLTALTSVATGQTITEFVCENNTNNTAVIVCPGGSYYWHDKYNENIAVAQWLNDNGISAYVLKYPVSGWASFFFHIRRANKNQYPHQLNSLYDALKFVKSKGYERVGLMGFSAGGHLVLNAAESVIGSLSPDFVTAIYPVITMNEPYVHTRSRRGLLGERRQHSQIMRDSLSLELHTEKINCPVFIMNCMDDPTVDYHNVNLFVDAMLKNHNSDKCYFLQYETGGHGFGVNPDKTSSEAIKWKDEWLRWIDEILNN